MPRLTRQRCIRFTRAECESLDRIVEYYDRLSTDRSATPSSVLRMLVRREAAALDMAPETRRP